MSRYRRPEQVVPRASNAGLTPRNQLLAEVMLRTTRLYVRRRVRQSLRQSSRRSIQYWLDQNQPCSFHNTTCEQVFAVQELADSILAYLDDFHDIACCLAVNRTFRHAIQKHASPRKTALPFRSYEDPYLDHMEKRLDLVHTSLPTSHLQRFSMNSGSIDFPRNAPWPLLVSIYDIYNSIGERLTTRLTVDIGFSASGHTPADFRLQGSWLDLSLHLPDTIIWSVSITCDCHRTHAFLDRLERSDPVDLATYRQGTRLVFPHRLVVENGDHLRQIASYAKRAYKNHRRCRNDVGEISTGLSSITFRVLDPQKSRYQFMDASAYTTSPSPKFCASPVKGPFQSPEVPREKARAEIIQDIVWEHSLDCSEVGSESSSGYSILGDDNVSEGPRHIASEDLVYSLHRSAENLSAWDKLMGRTAMKIGY